MFLLKKEGRLKKQEPIKKVYKLLNVLDKIENPEWKSVCQLFTIVLYKEDKSISKEIIESIIFLKLPFIIFLLSLMFDKLIIMH